MDAALAVLKGLSLRTLVTSVVCFLIVLAILFALGRQQKDLPDPTLPAANSTASQLESDSSRVDTTLQQSANKRKGASWQPWPEN